MFEATKKRPGDKRKREKNPDASDIDGYLGPWGKFVDEKTVIKPSEVTTGFPSHFYSRLIQALSGVFFTVYDHF